MFLPSCASLLAKQPTLESLIVRLDAALASMGSAGDIVAGDLAYSLGADAQQVETVLEELVELGDLLREERLFCENRCYALTPAEYDDASAEGTSVKCPACGTRVRSIPEPVYRVNKLADSPSSPQTAIPDGRALQPGTTHKMLFAAANPDVRALAIDEEWKQIERRFAHKERRVDIERVDRWATTTAEIRQAILHHRPTIVHFSGHGTSSGRLMFATDAREPQLVRGRALAGLFRLCGSVECVVLNACHSAEQADAIAQHVHCVVAIRGEIEDDAAIEFAAAFYDAVTAGEPFGRCFQHGTNALDLADLTDVDCPTVWINGINYPLRRPPN